MPDISTIRSPWRNFPTINLCCILLKRGAIGTKKYFGEWKMCAAAQKCSVFESH